MGRPTPDQKEELKEHLRELMIPVITPAFLPEEGDPLDLLETEESLRLIREWRTEERFDESIGRKTKR